METGYMLQNNQNYRYTFHKLSGNFIRKL